MPAAVQLFFKTEWIFRNNLIQPYFELKFCETRNITTKDWSSNNCLVFVHRNTDTDTSFRVFGFSGFSKPDAPQSRSSGGTIPNSLGSVQNSGAWRGRIGIRWQLQLPSFQLAAARPEPACARKSQVPGWSGATRPPFQPTALASQRPRKSRRCHWKVGTRSP